MTCYFAAAGMMAALLRRSIEGGSYHVKVFGARSAMSVQNRGVLDVGPSEGSRPKRFELLTPRFVVWCSIQLSYGRVKRPDSGKTGP